MSDDESTEPVEITVNDAFIERLKAVERAEQRLIELRDEVRDIDTGLRREDVVRLLYGRRNGLSSVRQIEAAFEGLEEIPQASDEELLRRLVSTFGDTTLKGAETFLEQVNGLRERYGDLAEEEEEST